MIEQLRDSCYQVRKVAPLQTRREDHSHDAYGERGGQSYSVAWHSSLNGETKSHRNRDTIGAPWLESVFLRPEKEIAVIGAAVGSRRRISFRNDGWSGQYAFRAMYDTGDRLFHPLRCRRNKTSEGNWFQKPNARQS
jgi:hypothetical protein